MKAWIVALVALAATTGGTHASVAPKGASASVALIEPRPECATPLVESGRPLPWASQLDEEARASLSAMIYLALRRANDDAPVRPQGTCAVARFTLDGADWTMHSGEVQEPLRWIAAEGRKDWFYLAPSVAPADAFAWARTRSGVAVATKPQAFILVGVFADEQYILQTYDGPPTPQLVAQNLAEVIERGAPPLGSFRQIGDVVTVFGATQSGLMSDIYSLGEINPDNIAYLGGGDGHFFSPNVAQRLVTLKGSGLQCPERSESFTRYALFILDTSEAQSELGCSYGVEHSIFAVYSTRIADASGDKQRFQRLISEEERAAGVSRRLSDPPTGPDVIVQAGRQWIDKEGLVQMLLFMRRGDYVIEVRVRHTPEDTEAVGQAILPMLHQISPDRR